MSLRLELEAAVARVPSLSLPLASEEAVKQSLVLPLLSGLGYDTVGLSDVVPEYPVGGGRVDYALFSGGLPSVLVECKRRNGSGGVRQLLGYMAAAGVGVGVLTDGVVWEFYGGGVGPFFVFDIRAANGAAISAFAGFSAGRDVAAAVCGAAGVGGLVGGGRAYVEEAVVAAVRCVVAGAGGDAAAVREERYESDTNVFFWPGSRNERRRLLRLGFGSRGVSLRVYGAGGNCDEVARVRLRAISDIAVYAAGIRAAAFRGCGGA